MLLALLYDGKSNQLKSLDAAGLAASAPSVAARTTAAQGNAVPGDASRIPHSANQTSANGTPRAALPACHDGEILWVDVQSPTREDFELIAERFQLHELVVEDIESPMGRPKLHDYGDYLYLVFHALSNAATVEEKRFELETCEIDCLVGPDYVVTLHPGPITALTELQDRWKRHPDLMQEGAPRLLYEVMDGVLDDYFPLLDSLDERIDEFEDRLFTDYQRHLSADIFALKRCLLQMRHIAGPTRDVVNTLMRHDAERGRHHFAYFQDLYDHTVRIVDTIDTFRDILSGALDAFLAMESNRMNEVMKTLTAASIMLLVPNLIAAIYGMNFSNMPELKTHNGYYFALGAMGFTVACLYALFKRKQWL